MARTGSGSCSARRTTTFKSTARTGSGSTISIADTNKRYFSISCKLMPEEEHGRLRHHLRDSSFSHAVGFDGDDFPREQGKGDKRKAKFPRRSPMFQSLLTCGNLEQGSESGI
ncbi:uncharacterized protein LOC144704701 [Wolffia australiana]